MAERRILKWPNVTLLKPANPIKVNNDSIISLFKDLADTIKGTENALGLAAPQIGVLLQMFIINITPELNNGNGTSEIEAFINPELILKESEFEWEEGCLSIPGEYGKVKRFNRIIVRYMDLDFNVKEKEVFGFLSGCIQHEIDHLRGKLWIDYQTQFKRDLILKKIKKKAKYFDFKY